MKAIITRQNPDGSFDEVGMNNRIVSSNYKTEKGLLRYAIPKHFLGKIRVELFAGNNIRGKSFKTVYIDKEDHTDPLTKEFPSVNINDLIRVKLTEDGKRILSHKRSVVVYLSYNEKVDMHEGKLWQLMNLFGDKLCMGSFPFFEKNRIYIIGE